jgi:hypothetical protein
VNCRKVSHLLSAFMDGELSGVEHRQLHEHLIRCPECQDDYEGLLQVKRLLGGMRVQTTRKALPALILQQISDEEWRAAHQKPSAWIQQTLQQLKSIVIPPKTAVLSIGMALMGVFFAFHLSALSTRPSQQNTITWEKTPPSLSEYTEGLDTTGSRRFLSQPASYDTGAWRRSDDLLITPVTDVRVTPQPQIPVQPLSRVWPPPR